MASLPVKKNAAHVTYIGLVSQSDTKKLQANPTIASGDFKISKDGGAFANLTNLPTVTPAAGVAVQLSLTSTEMNADRVVITAIDAAGDEWCDQMLVIETSVRQIDDLAYPATSGRSMAVAADGSVAATIVARLKKNTALDDFHFLMTDSTTHNPATGKTVTVTRVLEDGSFGAGTIGSVTEISNGLYRVDLPAADLNANVVTLRATASGCDDLFMTLLMEP